jgi:hypothetical protein
MDAQEIDRTLSETERALESGGKPDLRGLGFWRAVAAVKRDPSLVDRYADRIGMIDRLSFERSAPLRFPAAIGVTYDVIAIVVGIGLIALVVGTPTGPVELIKPPPQLPILAVSPWRELAFLAGMGAILVASHTLTHWIFGTLVGIRFTHWFAVPPLKPQPGFKTDYASYLRTRAVSRAWMHASGAIVTKLVPFAVYPFALRAGLEPWATWLIIAIGVITIVTDALWSVRASDWKKFRREMRAARAMQGARVV